MRRSKTEFYLFLRTKKHKIMSTEEKKRTKEELEAILQEKLKAFLEERRELKARYQLEEKQEWLKEEWDEMLKKISKWVDENKRADELLLKRMEWRLRWRPGIDNTKFYEEQGFRLGKGGKLLKEFQAWLTKKKYEWDKFWWENRHEAVPEEMREVRDILEREIAPLRESLPEPWDVENKRYAKLRYQLWYLYHKLYALEDIEIGRRYRQTINWLAKEWNWYLETKELMLRKTRSKDITGVIMSFC